MTSAATIGLALGAGLGAALLVACAGARPMAKSEAARSAEPAAPLGGDARERIRALDEAIATQLAAAGLAVPDPTASQAAAALPMADVAATCERSPRATCQDACKLGDSICDNATSICELAGELPGDTWAADRCASAKASCQRASDRCCRC